MVGKSHILTTKVTRNLRWPHSIKSECSWWFRCGLIKHRLFLLTCFIISPSLGAQTHFARLTTPNKQVVVGQSFNVRITVYTPTWFTKAPDFGEYQVDKSFTVKTDRARSNFETINGKRYTTLYFDYLVFPLQKGKLELPALSIQFESPDEGDYKGKPVTVLTNGASIEVKPLPDMSDSIPLFVATSAQLKETWNRPTTNLKVGDVLVRTIQINTVGTLSNMIPPTKQQNLNWASRYEDIPRLTQSYIEDRLAASRTEKHTYLIEEEGEFTLPEIILNYYNFQTRKWNQVSLNEKTLSISPNPDLQVLKSLQDSLNLASGYIPEEMAQSEKLIFGRPVKSFIQLLGLFVLAAAVIYGLLIKLIRMLKARKKDYLQSEKYFFNNIIAAGKRGNYMLADESIYQWLYRIKVNEKRIITLSDLSFYLHANELESRALLFHKGLYGRNLPEQANTKTKQAFDELSIQLKSARRRILANKRNSDKTEINQFHQNQLL